MTGFRNFEVRWFKVADLQIDYTYQRKTREARAQRIAQQWDDRLYDPITVSVRVDGNFVVDGAHRFNAAKILGIEELPCVVSLYNNIADEASGFVRKNDSQKSLTALEIYDARLVALDPIATDINNAMVNAGILVPSQLTCIGAVTVIATQYGSETLYLTMSIVAVYTSLGFEGAKRDKTIPVWLVAGVGRLCGMNRKLDANRMRAIIIKDYVALKTQYEDKAKGRTGSYNRDRIAGEVIATFYNKRLSDNRKIHAVES
jgi:hypothetical protein